MIGIIAARLKDHFNKPSIVITASNGILKGSARSIYNYNIGRAIKNSLDNDIIIGGGGHNMAAGFTLKKDNLKIFRRFHIEKFFGYAGVSTNYTLNYDEEISSLCV